MAESKQEKEAKAEQKRRLHRSLEDRVIAGVCGGFAQYLNLDATLVRIIWVVSVFLGGFGLLAYILSWIIVPEGTPGSESPNRPETSHNASLIVGLILVFIGSLFLFREIDWFDFPFYFHHWNPFWFRDVGFDVLLSLALIGFGVYYLVNTTRHDQAAKSQKSSGGTSMQKRLTRSTKDRMLAGVCGGIAEYFDIDPSLVRIGFVLLALFSGGGVLGVVAYIVMMIIIPEETAIESTGSGKSSSAKSQSK